MSEDIDLRGSNNVFINNDSISIGDDVVFVNSTGGLIFSNGVGAYANIISDMFFVNDGDSITNAGILNANRILFQGMSCILTNSGTLTTNGAVQVIAATDDDNKVENLAGGILNIGGDLQFKDADFIFRNAGTVNLTGRFDDMAGVDSILNLSGATWNYSGFHNANIAAEIDFYSNFDANTFNYNLASGSQQLVFAPKDAYWHLTLSGSGEKRTEGNIDINGDLTISGTANFNPNAGNDNISIAGNWANAGGTFDEGTDNESVTFDGSSIQTVSGGETFNDVILQNTDSGLVLSGGSMSISGNLDFSDGWIKSSSSNLVIFNNGSTASNAKDASYVFGPVRKIGQDIFTFPIGDTIFGGLQISPASLSTDAFDAQFFHRNSNPTFDSTALGAGINRVSSNEYWTIERTHGSSNVFVGLSWSANSGVTDLASILVASWDGSEWTSEGNGGTTGNATIGSVFSSSSTSNYIAYSLGTDSDVNNPLPIELIHFKASNQNNQVLLEWETASETNNDFFTVERSKDGVQFESIGNVQGAGNSLRNRIYRLIDARPLSGIAYYRLKQTDFDGKYSYSDSKSIHLSGINKFQKVYPNPALNCIKIQSNSSGQHSFSLYDSKFNDVSHLTHVISKNSSLLQLDISNLKAGTYYIKTKDDLTKFLKL